MIYIIPSPNGRASYPANQGQQMMAPYPLPNSGQAPYPANPGQPLMAPYPSPSEQPPS